MRRTFAVALVSALLVPGACQAGGPPGGDWLKFVDQDGYCMGSGVEYAKSPAVERYDITGDGLQEWFVAVRCSYSAGASGPSWVEVFDGASSPQRPALIDSLAKPALTDRGDFAEGIHLPGGCLSFKESTVTLHGRAHRDDDASADFSYFASQSFTWKRKRFEMGEVARLTPPAGAESKPPMCDIDGPPPVPLGKPVVVKRAGQELTITVALARGDPGYEAIEFDVTVEVRRGEWTFSNQQMTYKWSNGVTDASSSPPTKPVRIESGTAKKRWTMLFGAPADAEGAAITIADPNRGHIIGTWRLY